MPSLSLATQPPPEQPSLVGGALRSGFHEAVGNVGGAAEAIGTALDAPGLTDWGKSLAESQRQKATEAGRPDLEGPDKWSPKGIAYQLLKGVPQLAGALGTGALAAATLPETATAAASTAAFGAGAGLFSYPQAAGGNVAAAKAAREGALTPTDAAKSLGLAIPEAAAMSVMPSFVGRQFEAISGNLGMRALKGGALLGAYQAPIAAAQTAVTQQAFTPEMPIADRAREIVDSALSGGLQGAVFGGVSSALRRAPSTVKPATEVTNTDMESTVDGALGRPPAQIPPSEKLSPLPTEQARFADTPNDQLLKMAEPLVARGTDRTAAENVQHGLIQEEIARRTQPGTKPGEGTLFTPEQMAQRAPAIADTKKLAAGIAQGGADDPFFTNFNASSEPELVNALRLKTEGVEPKGMPSWLKTLAERYGVVGPDPAEQLVKMHAQEETLLKERDAAVAAGKVKLIRAANAAIIELTPKIREQERLLDLHVEGGKLLEPPPPLEPPVVDATGQGNLPGMGEKPPETPVVSRPEELATVGGQRELLTKQETGEAQLARQAAVKTFQDSVLEKFPLVKKRGTDLPNRATVEGVLRGMDVASEPELINALRKLAGPGGEADQANEGRLSAGLKGLASEYGVTDDTGGFLDMRAAHDALRTRYGDAIDRVRSTMGDGQKEALLREAMVEKAKLRAHEQLMEMHAQADELSTAPPVREIPDRVPEGMAKPWSLMQTIKEVEGVDPKVAKAADNAQKAIETNVPAARQIAMRAQQMFSADMRAKVSTKREGLPFREDAQRAQAPGPGMIEGGAGAVQEPGATGVLPREPAEAGGAVGQGHAKGNAPSPEATGKVAKQAVQEASVKAAPEAVATPPTREPTWWERAQAAADVGADVSEPGRIVAEEAPSPYDTVFWKTGKRSTAEPPAKEYPGNKAWQEAEAQREAQGPNVQALEARLATLKLPPDQGPVHWTKIQKLDYSTAKTKLEGMIKGLEPGDQRTPYQVIAERALAADQREGGFRDPHAVQDAEVTIAKMELREGVPVNRSVGFGKRPPAEAPGADWAKSAAGQVHGDVVRADADTALVRGFNDVGASVYIPVDRALGLRGKSDILSSSSKELSWLAPETRSLYEEAARQHMKAEAAALKKNPDGPFKGATTNVIGTPNADFRIVSYISNLVRQLGIDARILVTHPDDVRGEAGDKLGLFGPYEFARANAGRTDLGSMQPFGEGLKDFHIHINPNLSESMRIETAAHEVGHVVFETELRNAPKAVQDAIEAAYQKWFIGKSDAKAQDVIRATRNKETAAYLKDVNAFEDPPGKLTREYFTSKTEWFADQVSRWATTDAKPRTLLDRFFSAVAAKLREWTYAVTGNKFLPDRIVNDFMNHLWDSASDTQRMTDRISRSADKIPVTTETGPRTGPEVNMEVQRSVGMVDKVRDGLSEMVKDARISTPDWLHRMALKWQGLEGMAQIAGNYLKTAVDYVAAHTQRERIPDVINKSHARSMAPFAAATPETQALVNQYLKMLQNPHDIDGRNSWESHDWLRGHPDSAALQAYHREMGSVYSKLQQAGGRQALESTLQMSQTDGYYRLAAALQGMGDSWASKGVPIPGFEENPFKTYQMMSKAQDDPAATNGFWKGAVAKMRDGLAKYVNDQEAAAEQFLPSDPKKYDKAVSGLEDLKGFMHTIDNGLQQVRKGTYSPLGHGRGDFAVSGKLALGEDQKPTREATLALQNALEKNGFGDVGIFNDSGTIMTRVDTEGKMKRLADVIQGLEQDGHITGTKYGRFDNLNTFQGMPPKFMKAMAEAVKTTLRGTEEMDPKVAETIQQQLLTRWMDILPDQSGLKFLQPRKYVSGFDTDMASVAADRARAGARSSSFLAMQGDFAKVREAMRQEIQENKSNPDPRFHVRGHDVANELWLREAQQAWHQPSSPWDTAQSLMHTLRIGFNPPYVLTMQSQIPILLLPELAKKYGFLKSSQAIFSVYKEAFNVLRAVRSSPDWATVGFREDALRKFGLSDKTIDTVMRADNQGLLSNNTYTSGQTRLEGKSQNRYRDWANSLGLYAEMSPRLVALLAAEKLYEGRPVEGMTKDQYYKSVVDGSQFPWGPGQSSRATGSKGVFGQYSRISLAFMNFQLKMLEKLYTEAHDSIVGETPQARKEARTFLLGHMAATTAIAGTLGLPAAGMMAGLFDKLANLWTGRDDIDVVGMYRTYMSNMFGPGIADVLAKGLPRAAGMDFSHLGDQDLIPFTHLMENKRKWEDASRDWFKSMAGSAVGEVGNLYTGFRDIVNGDYLRGSIKLMPEGAKGLAEAYYLTKYGYIDKAGNRYPVQPTARDILVKATGIDPANEAQYEEANRIKTGLLAQRQYREQNISSHLIKSIMTPGSADTSYWMDQAMQYQLDHPGLGGPLESLQSDLTKFITKGGVAGAFNVPLGVKPLDFGIQRAAGFLTPQR